MIRFGVGLLAAGAFFTTAANAQPVPASTSPLPTAAPVSGMTIGFTARPNTAFVASTPGKAAFGMIGAFAAISAGKELVTTNSVDDPSPAIAHDVAAALAEQKAAQLAAAPIKVQHDKLAEFVSAAAGARYVVDAQTTSWGLGYFSVDWGHFHVDYVGRFKVIDTSTQKVVAQDTCKWSSNKADPADRPSRGELTDNGAAGLKTRLLAAEKACATQFAGRLAGL